MTLYDDTILATSGLVGYWPLSEPSGTSAVDAKNANNGTIVNNPTRSVNLGFSEANVGMTFNGSTQHVSIPNSANYQFGTGDFSLECWFFKSADVGVNYEQILNRGAASAGGNGYEIYLGDVGRYANSRIGAKNTQSAAPGYTNGAWHHLVFTKARAGNGTCYIDGSVSGTPISIASESAFSASENAVTYIASWGAGNYFGGGLAKVAMYNVSLSSGTVTAHYAARLSVPATGDISPFGRWWGL